jgi:hypothetical protein
VRRAGPDMRRLGLCGVSGMDDRMYVKRGIDAGEGCGCGCEDMVVGVRLRVVMGEDFR